MLITTLALLILFGTLMLVLGNLRVVLSDTYTMLATSASRTRANGTLIPRAAFAVLWCLVFLLSFI